MLPCKSIYMGSHDISLERRNLRSKHLMCREEHSSERECLLSCSVHVCATLSHEVFRRRRSGSPFMSPLCVHSRLQTFFARYKLGVGHIDGALCVKDHKFIHILRFSHLEILSLASTFHSAYRQQHPTTHASAFTTH